MYILVCTWTSFVYTVLWLPSILRTQIALEKQLGTCIPTVFQGDIMTILLDTVRIQWNNKHSVLCIQTKYIRVYTSTYMYVPKYSRYIQIPWY